MTLDKQKALKDRYMVDIEDFKSVRFCAFFAFYALEAFYWCDKRAIFRPIRDRVAQACFESFFLLAFCWSPVNFIFGRVRHLFGYLACCLLLIYIGDFRANEEKNQGTF